MSDVLHECHHPACSIAISVDLFACRDHWYRLPRDLRDEIVAAWRIRRARSVARQTASDENREELQTRLDEATARHIAAKEAGIAYYESRAS